MNIVIYFQGKFHNHSKSWWKSIRGKCDFDPYFDKWRERRREGEKTWRL